jgi:hypothetical protein
MRRRKNKDKVRSGGEVSVITGSHPEFSMAVRYECRQEERAEEEYISQALDPSVGSDHHWIKQNLHII